MPVIMRRHLSLLLCLAFTLGLSGQESSSPSSDPQPMTEYMGREIAKTMHWQGAAWLIRHKRDREEATVQMRKELKLQPGMTVCDMGCGNGYHTLPMAEAVGEKGLVYAVDVQPEMLEMLQERSLAQGLSNIRTIAGLPHDPKLPEGSCDLIVLVDVYHEFSHPVPMLEAMRKALKPDGKVVLVEFREEDETVPIRPEHKMSKAQINKELTANGFKLSREFDGLPWQHMMFFSKAEVP